MYMIVCSGTTNPRRVYPTVIIVMGRDGTRWYTVNVVCNTCFYVKQMGGKKKKKQKKMQAEKKTGGKTRNSTAAVLQQVHPL